MFPKDESKAISNPVGRAGCQGWKGWFSVLRVSTFFLCFCVLTSQVFASQENDLLLLPAEKCKGASPPFQVMDIVNTGDRLVAAGERGYIFYSENQGRDWVQASVPVSVTLTALDFPSPSQGWAVGHDGVILQTADGGKSWVKQLDGAQITQKMYGQVETRYAAKKGELENCAPALKTRLEQELESLDYFLSDLKAALDEGPSRPLMDVLFNNEKEGIVVGAFGMILHTGDGGKTWSPILDRIDNLEGQHYYGITRSGKSIFVAGEKGMLHRSKDDGRTWEKLESPYEGSFFGIVAKKDASLVMAYGLRGNVWCSTDMGKKWNALDAAGGAGVGAGLALPNGGIVLADYSGRLIFVNSEGKKSAVQKTTCQGCTALAPAGDGQLVLGGKKGLVRVEPEIKIMEK